MEASTGTEALGIVTSRSIDVVIVDNHMPGGSGLELISEVKSRPEIAHLPIILATGTSWGEDIDRARQFGAAELLMKPIDLGALRIVSNASQQVVGAP